MKDESVVTPAPRLIRWDGDLEPGPGVRHQAMCLRGGTVRKHGSRAARQHRREPMTCGAQMRVPDREHVTVQLHQPPGHDQPPDHPGGQTSFQELGPVSDSVLARRQRRQGTIRTSGDEVTVRDRLSPLDSGHDPYRLRGVNRRPRLRIVAPGAAPEEAAAVVAAIERFMRETAPPAVAPEPRVNPWIRAGRLEATGRDAASPTPWGDDVRWGR
jgi:hypothetical protein